jgi:alkylhydroperoxidase family enzyme
VILEETMSLILGIPPEKATGKLAELYQTAEQVFGVVPSNVRLLGVSPAILENQFQLIEYYMEHPSLKPMLLSAIRMLVSSCSESSYCEYLNTEMLKRMGVPAETVEAFKQDVSKAPFSENEKALLGFVIKAVQNPKSIGSEDVEPLKKMGWTDSDLLDAVAHGARAAATNVIFDTFKIDQD